MNFIIKAKWLNKTECDDIAINHVPFYQIIHYEYAVPFNKSSNLFLYPCLIIAIKIALAWTEGIIRRINQLNKWSLF